jgi:small-conductance mechanosensitive channel
MDFIKSLNLPFSEKAAHTYIIVALTILVAILLDNIFRSFIKVPKAFDNKRALTYVTIFRNIITALVYVIAINIILAELGIDITPLLASAGVVGVILGIGARSIIEDLITGLFLLSQHAIAIGDYVKIDQDEGTIASIGFRTLTINDPNGALIILPNGLVKKVINYSRTRATVTITLPVEANQDIDTVIKAAEKALQAIEEDKDEKFVLYTGSKVLGITDFKIGSDATIMAVSVLLITSSAKRWEAGNYYRYLVKKEFEKDKLHFV